MNGPAKVGGGGCWVQRANRKVRLDRVEELADEVYGQGAAISLDRERGGWSARVWDRKGAEVLWTWSQVSKAEAVTELGKKLEELAEENYQEAGNDEEPRA
jgi:hypothetical protein